MGTVIRNFAFDCADPYELAHFWAKVFDCPVDPGFEPDDEDGVVEPPGGTRLYFQRVPEPKRVKNRVHICLQPEVLRDQAVERIAALGATIVADHRERDGSGWVVMADPEGNEFCVLRSEAERSATG
ncbi:MULTISPECIES: VOC family protein [Micromonospora]|uniref:VOC family protein n=1 Tax=Micromonospora solifontis TaxID=2487138 RepID=A0ABX9W892_9ACTN|nr:MULTISPECIES: VOC family protein [Micromonospora]NES16087.1 VOC family protein [Micromonospora sp. PPF5-17B]NES39738.1 VOC family protein [Micromonospora solifontis]NES57439.1 VOC family protein [Micromonospora sp. PPF5-6]RNL86667.1 VOC family protein [Micromonospora solifontis]